MRRTDIDDVMPCVLEPYGLRTRREAVDHALRRLLVEPMDDQEVLGMRASGWKGNLDALRAGPCLRL